MAYLFHQYKLKCTVFQETLGQDVETEHALMVKSKCQGHSAVLPSQQVAGQESTWVQGCWQWWKGHRLYHYLLCTQSQWCWMIHSCCMDREWARRRLCVCVCHKTNTTHTHWVNMDVFYFSPNIHKGSLVPPLPFSPKQIDKQKLQQSLSPIPTKWVTMSGPVPFKLCCKVIAQKDEFSLWGCRRIWSWIPNEKILQSFFRQNLPYMQNEDQYHFLFKFPTEKQLKVREEEQSMLRCLESN